MSEDEKVIAAQSIKTDQQKQILQEILVTEGHYIEDLKILIEVISKLNGGWYTANLKIID